MNLDEACVEIENREIKSGRDNLSIERDEIQDEDDVIISIIDNFQDSFLEKLYRSLHLKQEFFNDYLIEEKKWCEKNQYFWGLSHKQNPHMNPEYVTDFLKSNITLRFRVYYAAKHSERFRMPFGEEIKNFFSDVFFFTGGQFGRNFT